MEENIYKNASRKKFPQANIDIFFFPILGCFYTGYVNEKFKVCVDRKTCVNLDVSLTLSCMS